MLLVRRPSAEMGPLEAAQLGCYLKARRLRESGTAAGGAPVAGSGVAGSAQAGALRIAHEPLP